MLLYAALHDANSNIDVTVERNKYSTTTWTSWCDTYDHRAVLALRARTHALGVNSILKEPEHFRVENVQEDRTAVYICT